MGLDELFDVCDSELKISKEKYQKNKEDNGQGNKETI